MKYHVIALLICFLMLIPTISAQTVNCVGTQESRLVIGERAQVIASGGSNLRARPYADSTLLNVIPTDELIPVIDGPFCAGGYAWWQVDYAGDRGWVAEGTDEFYWLAPYIIQRAQIGTVRIEIQPDLVTGISLERLADPLRSQFVLEGFPVTSNQIVPFIVVFDEVPDGISSAVEGHAVAHIENLEMGTRFVDIFFTEPIDVSDEITLVYHYMAITDDNRFIDAYFPISAPEMPMPYNQNESYFEVTAQALEAIAPDAFTPTLAQLDGIVRSINPHDPIEESVVFEYDANGIHMEYNPLLATGIREDLIPTSDIPEHILLTFEQYPIDEAVIYIYRAEDIAGATLSTLQQILSRQPINPPQIPIPSQSDTPLLREDLQYLTFANGEGVRYITSFREGEQLYSFQGLSTNGDYFVSALLPVSDDFPPLIVLDAMIESLQIGE